MDSKHNEKMLYEMQHNSVNEPQQFINTVNSAIKNTQSHAFYMQQFFLAKAMLVLGKIKPALELLHSMKPELEKKRDYFCLGKYYITLYNIQFLMGWDSRLYTEYYNLAEQYVKQSNSKALQCELKILNTLIAGTDKTLEMKEELLQEAMQDAIEANILDLKLEVYLAYSPLYLVTNMPEHASRELMLLVDMVPKEQNPFLYTQIYNYLGVIQMMLQEFVKSEKYLLQGITIAKEKGYKQQLVALMLNMGLNYVANGKIEEGISIYQECMQIVKDCGMENSVNANKVQDNLANALGRMDRLDEAIDILRSSLNSSVISNNKLRENILNVNLANILIEKEAFAEAEQLLDTAINYFTEEKNQLYLAVAYRCKARLLEAMESYKDAFEIMELLDRTNQKYFYENVNKHTSQYQLRIDKLRSEYLLMKSQCAENFEFHNLSLNTDLIGEHPSLKKALKDAFMAAKYSFANVFITGESGTGKEVIAQIIHNESKTGKPLVAINASAISPNLIESELFGHKKGAYTGAMEDRKGKFLLADKGTLFLDEISEMPVECQVKLLRAIETHTIQPVGSDKDILVNCRIISTSNCEMGSLIRNNKFRLDLYHRLNKIEIHLIPLRERISDLEVLIEHFVKRFSKELRIPVPIISEGFYQRLREYSFPGNIRELMNIVERIYILKPAPVWKADQLDGLIKDKTKVEFTDLNISHNLKQAEYQIIIEALEKTGWVQKETAKLLAMPESTLSRKIKSHGIKQ